MDGTFTSRTTTLLLRTAAGLVLAAAALFAAAPAHAADPASEFAAGSPAVQAAETVARDYWQATPCGGQVELVWTRMGESTNATSTWSNPVGQYDAPERNSDCQITFNSALAWDQVRFCSILVHEYGHLLGRAHADDPADVMYAYYEAPVGQCDAAAPTATALVEPTPAVPALAPAPAATPQPRAISSSRVAKRGVLVLVRKHRRDAHRLGKRAHHRHGGHRRA